MASETVSTVSGLPVKNESLALTRILPNAGALYVSTIVQAVGRFVIGVMIGRALGADGLGIFSLGFIILQTAVSLALFGIETGLFHYISPAAQRQDENTVKSMLRASLLSTFVLSVLIGALVVVVIPFYRVSVVGMPQAIPALQLFVLALPFQVALGILGAYALALGSASVKVLAERLIPTILQVGLLFVLLGLGGGMVGVVLAFVGGTAIGALTAAVMVWRMIPARAATQSVSECWQKLYRYSYPQGLARVLGYALMNANLFLLGYLSDSFQLGLYAAASRLTLLGLLFLEAFGQIFAASAASEQNREMLRHNFQRVTRWIVMTSYPLFILLAVFAPVWMTLMGVEFGIGGEVLSILAVAQLISMSTGAIAVTLAVRGFPKIAVWNNLLGWGTSAVLTFVLAQVYGALGAAVAYLGAILVFWILEASECRFLLGFMPFARSLWKPLGVVALYAVVSYVASLLYPWDLYTLAPLSVLLLAGYGLLIWRVALSPEDIDEFRELVGRVRGRANAPA